MSIAEIEFGMLNRQWAEPRKQSMKQYLAAHDIAYGDSSKLTRSWADLV